MVNNDFAVKDVRVIQKSDKPPFKECLKVWNEEVIKLIGAEPCTEDGYWICRRGQDVGIVHEENLDIIVRAITKHDVDHPDELSFVKYERLTLVSTCTDQPNWWMCINDFGQKGLVPANYIELESYQSNYGDGMFDPVKPARVRPVKHEAHMASRLFTPVTDEEFLEADQGTLHEVGNLSGASVLYIILANFMQNLTSDSGLISKVVMYTIMLCSLSAGLETYPTFKANYQGELDTFNNVALIIFITEIFCKIIAEGFYPWRYFVGSEWRWNWFDLVIVGLCLIPEEPGEEGGGAGYMRMLRMLRMLRMVRVLKVLRKVAEIRLILAGIFEGVKGAVWILLLMVIIYYLYAVLALQNFAANDPWHFANLGLAFLTLFRCTTCEDWTDVMYINTFGCENYGYDLENDYNIYGCTQSTESLLVGPIYFCTMIMVTALVMLSLFVGVICAGMDEGVSQMKAEADEDKAAQAVLAREMAANDTTQHVKENDANKEKLMELIQQAWCGERIKSWYLIDDDANCKNPAGRFYLNAVSVPCFFLTDAMWFQNFIMLVIVVCSVLAGVEASDPNFGNGPKVQLLEFVILVIFCVEVVLKILSVGLNPFRYFHSRWNLFDFIIVSACFMPGGGSFAGVLRLARLLRVLRLLESIPQLQVIVQGLLMGLSSIGYIAVLVFLSYYLFAIVGIQMFRQNDPWHFPNLHWAMVTLFRCSTMEDWTDVMYINMYGCDKYGYDHDNLVGMCNDPEPNFTTAIIYFVIFEIFSALVMMTLFIGVVCTGIDVAREQLMGLNSVVVSCKISPMRLASIKKIFTLCDIDHNGSVDMTELQMVLDALHIKPGPLQLKQALALVDDNSNGVLELSEFVLFMYILTCMKGTAPAINHPMFELMNASMRGNDPDESPDMQIKSDM